MKGLSWLVPVFLLFSLSLPTLYGRSPAGNWSELPPYLFAWYTGSIEGWRQCEFPEERFPGMNMVYSSQQTDTENIIKKAINMSIAAREDGVALVIGLYWSRKLDVNYSRMVRHGKRERWVPSPSDKRYWDEVVTKPAVALANLSLYYPIYGTFWNLELDYKEYVDHPSYSWDQYSLDKFGKEKGVEIPKLNDSQRRSWIFNQGLMEEFKTWQEEKVYQFAKETERLVHDINPDFALGTLAYYDEWFGWAIRKAFDNERVPTFLWCERTYSGYMEGSHPEEVQAALDKIDSLGLNCLYFPGFWIHRRSPEELLDDMQHGLTNCNRFWIYSSGTPEPKPGRHWDEYVFVFRFFEDYFFNSEGEFAFQGGPEVYPGTNSRAYVDGDQVQLLLFKNTLDRAVKPPAITIHIDPSNEKIAWKNFSLVEKEVTTQNGALEISSESLPIVIYNLTRDDLQILKEGGRYEYMHLLHSLSSCLELDTDPTIPSILDSAITELEKGRAVQCGFHLDQAKDTYIADLIGTATTYVQQAPDWAAPYSAKYGLDQARSYWKRGAHGSAKKKLLNSLSKLCTASIPETQNLTTSLLVILLITVGLVPVSSKSGRGKTGRGTGSRVDF